MLFEIANGVGTPLMLDNTTKRTTFGHYVKVLVDVDLSKWIYDEIMVERDGYIIYVDVVYERLLEYCHNCFSIGFTISNCHKLNSIEKVDNRGKKHADKGHIYVPKKVATYFCTINRTSWGCSYQLS